MAHGERAKLLSNNGYRRFNNPRRGPKSRGEWYRSSRAGHQPLNVKRMTHRRERRIFKIEE